MSPLMWQLHNLDSFPISHILPILPGTHVIQPNPTYPPFSHHTRVIAMSFLLPHLFARFLYPLLRFATSNSSPRVPFSPHFQMWIPSLPSFSGRDWCCLWFSFIFLVDDLMFASPLSHSRTRPPKLPFLLTLAFAFVFRLPWKDSVKVAGSPIGPFSPLIRPCLLFGPLQHF